MSKHTVECPTQERLLSRSAVLSILITFSLALPLVSVGIIFAKPEAFQVPAITCDLVAVTLQLIYSIYGLYVLTLRQVHPARRLSLFSWMLLFVLLIDFGILFMNLQDVEPIYGDYSYWGSLRLVPVLATTIELRNVLRNQ
ncbi:hypothetical protein EDD86DRAFT_200396 [Gorgonomyces haynaldii]|nr:hypothetical protein EDD86DRAFT_200396 [Gorgonomyces haynaldii]